MPQDSDAKIGCGLLIVSAAGLFILWKVLGDSSLPEALPSEAEPHLDLQAAIRYDRPRQALTITNNDQFVWTNCRATINVKLLGADSQKDISSISAGGKVFVLVTAFAGSDGTRFDPTKHPLKNVTLSCETPSGRGSYSAGWTN